MIGHHVSPSSSQPDSDCVLSHLVFRQSAGYFASRLSLLPCWIAFIANLLSYATELIFPQHITSVLKIQS